MVLRDWTDAGRGSSLSDMSTEFKMKCTHMKDKLDTIWREKNYIEAWHETNTCTSDGIQGSHTRDTQRRNGAVARSPKRR